MTRCDDFNRLWNMSQALVYFCGKNEELLPAKEDVFLTELFNALDELSMGIEKSHSFHVLYHESWGYLLAKQLPLLFSELEKKGKISGKIVDDLKKMINLEWESDELGDGEYSCVFSKAYKGVRDNSGYTGSIFKLQPKEKERLEKKVIPTISADLLNFYQEITPVIRKYVDNDIEVKNQRLKGVYW